MGNLAEKFNPIKQTPEEEASHTLAEARKKQYLERAQSQDNSNVFSLEDLGTEPMPEEIIAQAERVNMILKEAKKKMETPSYLRDQKQNFKNNALSQVADDLKVLKKWRTNTSPMGNKVRDAFNTKERIESMDL